ncbi:hypothetical protein AABM34_20250 [Lysinibacillus fusiformis]
MWKKAALEKISNEKGTIDFKSKRELQGKQKIQIKKFEEDISKLKKINVGFDEIPVEIIVRRQK